MTTVGYTNISSFPVFEEYLLNLYFMYIHLLPCLSQWIYDGLLSLENLGFGKENELKNLFSIAEKYKFRTLRAIAVVYILPLVFFAQVNLLWPITWQLYQLNYSSSPLNKKDMIGSVLYFLKAVF